VCVGYSEGRAVRDKPKALSKERTGFHQSRP
jgi:hypothetical protein